MGRISVKSLLENHDGLIGQSVSVAGWIRTSRDQKSHGFIELNDGSSFKNLQIVVGETLDGFKEVLKYGVGSAITVDGVVVRSPNEKQPVELQAGRVRLEGLSSPEYPLQKKRHSVEYLRTLAHLRPRTNLLGAAFRVRSAAAFAVHSFFNERGFVYVHTPILTGSDSEGAGAMFRVTTLDLNQLPKTAEGKADFSKDFFERPANLTVSGQLEAEVFALAFGKTYSFGPTFRAEKSNTPRHAAEFWMIEPEIAFAELCDNMQLAEELVRYVIDYVMKKCPEEIAFFNSFVDNGLTQRLEALVESEEFARLTYTEAVRLLEEGGEHFEYKVFWGCDLQTEHERYITEKVMKRPTFVTDYPKQIKAFYMRLNDDGKTVAAMDLLVPGVGELIGGSQREERADVLLSRIEECGLNAADYEWYLDLRRFGGTKHAGFGLGFERLIMYLTGITNIRDVLPFPRTVGSIDF